MVVWSSARLAKVATNFTGFEILIRPCWPSRQRLFNNIMSISFNANHIYYLQAIAKTGRWIFACMILCSSAHAYAACPKADDVDQYVDDYINLRPNTTFTASIATVEDAECARGMVVERLKPFLGPVIGYKAIASHDEIRNYLSYPEPLVGVMFGKNLLQSPAKVPAKHGVVPFWEIDMIVEVKSPALADAKNPLEALNYLSHFVPFLELPDGMTPGQRPRAIHFIASNGGFRNGVLGKPIAIQPNEDFLKSLAEMNIVVTDDKTGEALLSMKGNKLMGGNPVNVAIWMAKKLKAMGVELKAGDRLSLGGALLQVPKQGTSITMKYVGLPAEPSVSVQFD